MKAIRVSEFGGPEVLRLEEVPVPEPGAGLANGALRPVVGRELPLSEASRAHREIMEPGASGKLVLVPPEGA